MLPIDVVYERMVEGKKLSKGKARERQAEDRVGVEGVLNSIVLKMFTSFLNTYLIYYLAGFQCTLTLHFQQRRS